MVSFGTNTGPIVPAQPISSTVAPNAPKTPAPVYENVDDIPNPHPYKPISPHQYRNKIYEFKPHPNLILGTPIDQKYQYNPSLEKHNYYKKLKLAKALGFEYRGPALFDKQAYEVEREKYKALQYKEKQAEKRYDQNPSQSDTQYQQQSTGQYQQQQQQPQPMRSQNSYTQQTNPQLVPYNSQVPVQNNYQYSTTQSPNNYQTTAQPINRRNDNEVQRPQRYTHTSVQTQPGNYQSFQYQYNNQQQRYVPQIGIAYSSGLKYYVPQGLGYYQDGENSVYQQQNQQYYN